MKHMETMLPMEDGVKLYTLTLLPEGEGPYSAVFARTPYDPAPSPELIGNVENTFRGYLARGFAVVWQHCRGRGGSEGEFVPFKGERADGLRTLAWLEKQPFFDGRAYLWGGSYLAYVHLSYLAVAPACVKGAALPVMGVNGALNFYKNGVFKADLGPMWYMDMYRHHRLTHGTSRDTYDAEFRKYPVCEFPRRAWGEDVPSMEAIMNLRDDPLSDPGGYSEAYYAAKGCPVPLLLIDGWSEMFFNAMTEMWRELPGDIRARSAFLLGPWSHGCRVDESWTYPFPQGDLPGDASLDWFLHLRDGAEPELSRPGHVRYYRVGEGTWETAPDFPQGKTARTLHLRGDRTMGEDKPDAGEISWTYDPQDPPFFPGGPDSFVTPPAGFAPQPEPNFRPDVISFLTAPQEKELRVEGKIKATLLVSSDCDATAFVLRLCCASGAGTAVMQEAVLTLEDCVPGQRRELSVTFDPVCWTVHAGERLRLDVASADATNYYVHPNCSGDWRTVADCRQAVNRLHFPGCRIELPIG